MDFLAGARKIAEKLLQKFLSGSLFYVNGPDNLPPPLTKEEEEKVMR